MKDKKNRNHPAVHYATPFILLALCTGIAAASMIKPADKLKVYANIAFMDDQKLTGDDTGLVIRDNEIIENYNGETSETGEVIRPQFGERFSTVYSSAIGLDVPVYWGNSAELFERGACQSSGSALPGTDGNAVISAHVDTFFADLSKLKTGDTVKIRTNYGEFEYEVRTAVEFKSSNNKYVNPSEENILTLYTCKKDVLGSADERIGFICDLKKKSFYTGNEVAG